MRDGISWLTVVWSMNAAACLSFAMIHFFIWCRQRQRYVHLLFSMASLAVAGIGAGELFMMRARSVDEFITALRFVHIPVFFTIVSIVGYVHLYFRTGRVWLMFAICGLRFAALVVNFSVAVNLNYTSVTRLNEVYGFFGERAAVAEGIGSPWGWLGQISSLLFVVFVTDASISLWRTGSAVQRRRAALVGGSITFFSLVAVCQTILVNQGLLRMPYLISVPFLIPIIVMAHELSNQVVQAAILGDQLSASRANLIALEQRISLAADAAQLGFWEWNITDDTVWMTDTTRGLLALIDSDPISMKQFLSRVQDEDQEHVRIAIERSVRDKVACHVEFRVNLSQGPTRWLAASGKVVNDGTLKTRLRGVVTDITKRCAMEQDAARQRHQLTHLSRVTMLGELSGSLAHELNQPLTAILCNAQAASRFLSRDACNVDEVREILTDIIAADKRAGEIIRHLRLLFKKGEVEEKYIDLNALIQEVLHFLNSDLINHMVAVQTQLSPEIPQVKGDRVQLQQVLINIIMNACEAMSAAQRENRVLLLSTMPTADSKVQITIADRGVGIPEAEMDRIFEPFVTTRQQGMGMGLAVCRTIITAHGGQLWASANAPQGATFHVVLPAAKVESA